MRTMKRVLLAAIVTLMVPAAGIAQRISLDAEKELAARAVRTVEVTLDGPLLRLAARFLGSQDADSVKVANLVRRLEGIYVRSYEFDGDGQYDRAAVSRFRSSIGTGWQKIVNVSSIDEENVEVYTQVKGDMITGLVLIAAEPRELTFVNIVGPIDLEELASLEGQFGIPRIVTQSGANR
ncbi:MAG TPA: DUF4252 domain-containing protein [Thermoanaerobaculia bacterium]|nr:DUF4252 domain-containing protein [Thermoanaerobaculia bacterium]